MNKPNILNQKNIEAFPSNNLYNLSSSLNIPKINQYFNIEMSKNKPIAFYHNCLSPDKNFSVNMMNTQEEKNSQNNIYKYADLQKNLNSKMFQSPNTTNSDLLTVASLTSQQSNESFLSNSTINAQCSPNTFQVLIPRHCSLHQLPNRRFTYSLINNSNFYLKNYCNKKNNEFSNGINTRNNIKLNNKKQPEFLANKTKNNNQNNQNHILKNNKFQKNCLNNNQISSKNTENLEIKISYSDNSLQLVNASNKTSYNNDISRKNTNEKKENGNNKKFYNKFNSPKDNYTNENTVILTLKIKVGPNDYRFFNLKKYDDLFVSLEKFFDINKISQSLVKPIVTKIFMTLNKIFWLLNNKIGKYDYDYLNSLYKLWIKNNQNIPKNNTEEQEIKRKDNNSKISYSDSSDDDSHKNKKKSNSFQNTDSNSEDGKNTSAKSF
jgi:hypothetical protein